MKKYILSVLFIFTLSSCKTYMSYDDMRHLRKGMNAKDAESEIDLEPVNTYRFSKNGADYEARRYDLQIGVSKTTSHIPGFVAANGVRNYGTTYVKETANTLGYLLLYREGKLIYWGFLQEFSKSEDPLILGLSSELRNYYYAK